MSLRSRQDKVALAVSHKFTSFLAAAAILVLMGTAVLVLMGTAPFLSCGSRWRCALRARGRAHPQAPIPRTNERISLGDRSALSRATSAGGPARGDEAHHRDSWMPAAESRPQQHAHAGSRRFRCLLPFSQCNDPTNLTCRRGRAGPAKTTAPRSRIVLHAAGQDLSGTFDALNHSNRPGTAMTPPPSSCEGRCESRSSRQDASRSGTCP